MTAKRHYPPSRAKYERRNPTLTVRVDAALYDEVQKLRRDEGFSYGDVFRAGLDRAELVVKKAREKARQEGYRKGFAVGSEAAKRKYMVSYFCADCRRKHLSISSDEEKDAAAMLMFEAGWRSNQCSSN